MKGKLAKLAPYRKSIIAGLVGFFGTLTDGLADGNVTGVEIAKMVGGTVIPAVAVYLIPNGKKAKEIQEKYG